MLSAHDALSRNPVLARFAPERLDRLALAAEQVSLQAGAELFTRNQPADRLYLVAEGRIDLLLDDDAGNRTRVEILMPPRLAGLSPALDGGAYAYTAIVESPSALVFALPASEVLAELAVNAAATKLMLAEASVRLRRLVGQLGDLKLRDSVQRLAGYLIELCAAELGPAEVILPSEKRAVADRLGMKPETLSRALARLESLGLAQSGTAAGETARLRLPDVARLRHLYLAGEESGLA